MLFQQAAPKEFRTNTKYIAATHNEHVQYILYTQKTTENKESNIENILYEKRVQE